MEFPIANPESEPETTAPAEAADASSATPAEARAEASVEPGAAPEESVAQPEMEAAPASDTTLGDVLKQLRKRKFSQETTAPPEASGAEMEQSAEETEGVAFEQLAAAQTNQTIEQLAAEAAEQTGSVLERLAVKARQQTGRALERLAAEAAEQTSSVLAELAELAGLVEEATQPNVKFEELSTEVRRVGRELFKANRTTERNQEQNQEMFAAALEELRLLAARVAQVPAQLQSAESIVEVKAALCRDLLGVADALEASLLAAQEVLAQLQPLAEQTIERAPQRRGFFRAKIEQLALRIVSQSATEQSQREATAVAAMSQWRDGQQLLYERLLSVLHTAGVRRIEAVGYYFNSALHRAVSVEQRSDLPAGTIVGEERKGYLLNDRILRYAEVIVVKHE